MDPSSHLILSQSRCWFKGTRLDAPTESQYPRRRHPLDIGCDSVSHLDVESWVYGVIQVLLDSDPGVEVSTRLIDVGPWVVITPMNVQYSLDCVSS